MNREEKFDMIRESQRIGRFLTWEKFDMIRESQRIGRFLTWDVFQLLQQIGTLSRRHKYYCECSCNGIIEGNIWTDEHDRIVDNCERQIHSLIDSINGTIPSSEHRKIFTVEIQHDPRGQTVKLHYGNIGDGITDIYYLL
jgi:hypothetical protein